MVQLILSAVLQTVTPACTWCGLRIWMIRLLELSLLAALFIIEIVGSIRLKPGRGRNVQNELNELHHSMHQVKAKHFGERTWPRRRLAEEQHCP